MASPFIPLAPDTFSGRRLGKYEIVCRLSTGGMSEIFLAFQKGVGGFRKYCVLKQILPDIKGEEEFVRMFLDEAKITAAFNHPNIAHVYDLDIADGELFLAMEFVPGATLVEVARMCRINQEPIPIGMTLQSVRDTALALHYAHNFTDPLGHPQPVIHRDIAEKNIMVTFEGTTKLLDFGIAKNTAVMGRTMVGMVKGTTGYMSPEQILGEKLDGRSDLFSLGVVLHECLTGMRLFHAKTPEQGMMAPLKESVAPPSRQNAQVPPEIDAVVLKSLRRNRDERYDTLLEFARELERAAGPLMWRPEQTAPFVQRLFAERREQTRQLLSNVANDERTGETKIRQLLQGNSGPLLKAVPPPPPLPPELPPEPPSDVTDPKLDNPPELAARKPAPVAPIPARKPTAAQVPRTPSQPVKARRESEHTDPLINHRPPPPVMETTHPGEFRPSEQEEAPEPVTVLNRPTLSSLLDPLEPGEQTEQYKPAKTWQPPPVPEQPHGTPWDAEITGNGPDDEEPEMRTLVGGATLPPEEITGVHENTETTGGHDTVSNMAPAGSGRRRFLGLFLTVAVICVAVAGAWYSGALKRFLPADEMQPVTQGVPGLVTGGQLPEAGKLPSVDSNPKPEKKESPQVAAVEEQQAVVDAGAMLAIADTKEQQPPPAIVEAKADSQQLNVVPDVQKPPEEKKVVAEKKAPPPKKKVVVEKKVAEPAESKATGQLTLVTTPWAKVEFKSKDLGATPLFKVALPVGKHTLKLTGPDNQVVMLPVEIKENEVTTLRQKLADLTEQ